MTYWAEPPAKQIEPNMTTTMQQLQTTHTKQKSTSCWSVLDSGVLDSGKLEETFFQHIHLSKTPYLVQTISLPNID
uniref:Uncharacterized protein n=1 Tax=Arion vulgaris TaxID=1028688 RepID=A0A0B7A2I0_9EUPU